MAAEAHKRTLREAAEECTRLEGEPVAAATAAEENAVAAAEDKAEDKHTRRESAAAAVSEPSTMEVLLREVKRNIASVMENVRRDVIMYCRAHYEFHRVGPMPRMMYPIREEDAIQMNRRGIQVLEPKVIQKHPLHTESKSEEEDVRWKVKLMSYKPTPREESDDWTSCRPLRFRERENVTFTTEELVRAGFQPLSQCRFLAPLSDQELADRRILSLRDADWTSSRLVVSTSTLGVPPTLYDDTKYFPYPTHLVSFVGSTVSSPRALIFVIERSTVRDNV